MTIAVYIDGRWHPGIGDPTPMGWVTVAAYGVAAMLCAARAVRDARRRKSDGRPAPVWFWWTLAAGLVALAINKQLDLQSWFTQTGKELARAGGWYEQRRSVQGWLVAGVAAGAIVAMTVAIVIMRRVWRTTALALVGVAFLLAFIVVRAASFHHVDRLLRSTIGGVKLNWALELGGIAVIAVAACLPPKRRDRPADLNP